MQGILFTEPMYKAIIELEKYQTRRIIKIPKGAFGIQISKNNVGKITGVYAYDGNESTIKPNTDDEWLIKPRYKVGETAYLKEPYIDDISMEEIFYKFKEEDLQVAQDCGFDHGWKNKMFMPESCARNFIKFTNIKRERLHDISESDCIAEGIFPMVDPIGIPGFGYDHKDKNFMWSTAKQAYQSLWCKINGIESWNANPFVYVYDFDLVIQSVKS